MVAKNPAGGRDFFRDLLLCKIMSKVFFVVINTHHESGDENNKGNNSDDGAQKSVAVHERCGNSENNKADSDKGTAVCFAFASIVILLHVLFVFEFHFCFIRNKFLFSCVFASSDKNNSENNAKNEIYVIHKKSSEKILLIAYHKNGFC